MSTAITPRLLVEECGRLGIDRKRLLTEAGMSPDFLSPTRTAVPLESVFRLWEGILRLSPDQMLGMHSAERLPFGAYRVLDYMMSTSSSPRDALERSSRTFTRFNTAFSLPFYMRRDLGCLELEYAENPRSLPRPYIEYIFTNYLVRLRFATRRNINPVEVHVTYKEPANSQAYGRVFGARFRFGQPANRIIFQRHLMEIPLPLADLELCELLEQYTQRRHQDLRAPKTPLQDVREVLVHGLRDGSITLAQVARQLAKSIRSLQRELHANGTTFHELLANVRQEQAQKLLGDFDFTIAEIASQLSFSSTSAFCRAFQNWTGRSPSTYRKFRH
jgi:AraC-like DNA-binding protein